MTDLATQGSDPVEPIEPEQHDEPLSQSDTMRAVMADIKERQAKEEPEELPALKVDRSREKDGKFAKGETPPAAKSAEPAKGKPATNHESVSPAATQAPALQPPNGLTAEGKTEFSKASPALQREIVRRENDFHKYYKEVEPLKQAAQYGNSMYQALKPFEQRMQSMGLDPARAAQALFSADHKLTYGSPAEKLQAFSSLAKEYGIDLSQGLPQQQQIDPNFAWLQNKTQQAIQAAQQANERARQIEARHQQERDAADKAHLNSMLTQAKQNKPHFDELSPEIGLILQSQINRGQDIADPIKAIEQAYEAALWASPTHRTELLTKQQEEKAAAANQQRSDLAGKARLAKQASSTNVPKRGTLPPQRAVGSQLDIMRETLARIKANQQ